jgi:chromosome segregation ATPase
VGGKKRKMMVYLLVFVILCLIVTTVYFSNKFNRFHKYYEQRLKFFQNHIDDFGKQSHTHKKHIDIHSKHLKTLSKFKDAMLTKQNEISRGFVNLESRIDRLDESVITIFKNIERLRSPRKFQTDDIVKFNFDSKRLVGGKIANCREQTDGIFYSIIHKNKRYRDIPESSITK